MSLDNLDDVLGGGGGATAFTKDTPMGTTFRGPIIDATVQQIKDIRDQKPKVWDDGRPQQQIVIRIQTDLRNDAEDDGVRALYVKTWGVWKEALVTAQNNGRFDRLSEALAPGNIFADTYYADKPAAGAGLSPTKLHRYEIQRMSSPMLDVAVNQATGEVAPVPQQYVQPVQQVAPVQYQQPAPVQQHDPWVTPTPQQYAQQPVQAAPPVAVAPAAPAQPDPADIARQLIALGMPDAVVAQQTGLADVVVAALRGQAAAA
ncbi:hypothetical protein [Arthrobacter sp. GMC3]|uniref:hypothetical protein n=1 Tax=Arthrobacter sp. GMC3 TaxID=2058894 RepID=UPI000CE3C685|nr:hypothetical protein [Arthrobacter sp. GMC3]